MKNHDSNQPTTSLITRPLLGCVVLASGLFAACGGSVAPVSSINENVVTDQPDPRIGSQFFIGDSHFNGNASTMRIVGISWGRLVNVADETNAVQMRDLVIGSNIRDGGIFLPSSGGTIVYRLARNAVTNQFLVTIPEPAGSERFNEALANLEANLTPIFDKSLDPNELPPFSMAPRNATVVVRFNDLLEPVYDNGAWVDAHSGSVADPGTGQLRSDLIQVSTGYPPETPYEARIFLDPNHGNLLDKDSDGVAEFYSTRVVLSPTISPIEAQSSNPPLGINSLGLPASVVTDAPNLAFRIPTLVNAPMGQSFILRSAGGKPVSFSGNGSTDNSTGTNNVVRALRSGGDLTDDPHNGFLLDEDPPVLLGDFAIALVGTPFVAPGDPFDVFTLPQLNFDVVACSAPIKLDDVVAQSGVSGLVIDPGIAGTNIRVQVIAPSGGVFLPGGAQLQTPFDPNVIGVVPACFVRFSPTPGAAPASDVQPNAAVFVRFSEPMDPETVKPFDSFTIHRALGSGAVDETAFGYAIGRVVPESDLRTFRWDHPDVPFDHTSGTAESFFMRLATGTDGPTDLAGNPLVAGLPEIEFRLNPIAQEGHNAGFALRFETLADDLFGDGLPELRGGQLLFDPVNERVLPRPVGRFSSAADTNHALPSVMIPFVGGIQTPLSNLGSKLHTVWRYMDVGFSLTDETNYNIDVEGLAWAPSGGLIVADAYNEFSVTLAHSKWLPDEYLDPGNGFPRWQASGVKQGYAGNLLDPIGDGGTLVHERSLGYVVNPANLFTATSGKQMVPFPVNEGKALEDFSFYTWRDTALTALGGPSGGGAPPWQEYFVTTGNDPAAPPVPFTIYPVNQVPTVGLPLLMEFRCYPADEALGLNALDIALAVNSSARPNFRAFSTGGFDGNQLVFVDPDNQDTAAGGWNPNTNNPTPGTDNSFYIGEMALVTRVSRIHSIWFDTDPGGTTYAQPVLEPEAVDQPTGTSVSLAFRGAVQVSGNSALLTDAGQYGPYGNPATGTVQYLPATGDAWKNDITQINGAQFFQIRITFISNAATGRTAELRTLAFAYYKG